MDFFSQHKVAVTFLDRKWQAPVAIPASRAEAGRMEGPECARNNRAPLSCKGGHLSCSPGSALWSLAASSSSLLLYGTGACSASSTSQACHKALRHKMLERSKNIMAAKMWRAFGSEKSVRSIWNLSQIQQGAFISSQTLSSGWQWINKRRTSIPRVL